MRSLVKLYQADKPKVLLSLLVAAVAAFASVVNYGGNDAWSAFLPFVAWISSGIVTTSIMQVETGPGFRTTGRTVWLPEPGVFIVALVLFFGVTLFAVVLAGTLAPTLPGAFEALIWQVPQRTLLVGAIVIARSRFVRAGV